jgi:hypothetical protein
MVDPSALVEVIVSFALTCGAKAGKATTAAPKRPNIARAMIDLIIWGS